MIELALGYLKKIIGPRNLILISFFSLGIYATTIADQYVATPEQVEEKVQKAGNVVQLQIYELQIQGLTNELYQLKKLKSRKLADDDDLDRLQEVKKELDSIKTKKDSLQTIINKK